MKLAQVLPLRQQFGELVVLVSFLMVFWWVFYGFQVSFLWFSGEFSMVSYGFLMSFLHILLY